MTHSATDRALLQGSSWFDMALLPLPPLPPARGRLATTIYMWGGNSARGQFFRQNCAVKKGGEIFPGQILEVVPSQGQSSYDVTAP